MFLHDYMLLGELIRISEVKVKQENTNREGVESEQQNVIKQYWEITCNFTKKFDLDCSGFVCTCEHNRLREQ